MPDAFFPFTSGCPVIFGNLVSAACLPFMFIHTPTHQLASLALASLLFPSCLIVVLKALSAPQTSLPRLAIAVNVFPAASPSTPPTQILCFAFADSGCLDPVQIDPFHRSSARQIDPPHVLTCLKPQSRQFQLGRRQVSNVAGLICKKKLNNLCHLLLGFDVGRLLSTVPMCRQPPRTTHHDISDETCDTAEINLFGFSLRPSGAIVDVVLVSTVNLVVNVHASCTIANHVPGLL